jgi:hypothetical protein
MFMWMLREVWVIISWRAWVVKMFMKMLHEVWLKGLISENGYVNVTWSLADKYIKRSSKENVYVNVTWGLGDN